MEGTDGASSSSSSSHGILPVRATVRRRSIAATITTTTTATAKEVVAASSSSFPTTTTTEATTTMSHHLLRDLAAGGVAGSAGVVVGHPFDSIKVRMQNTTAAAVVSASSSSSFLSLAPSSSPSSSTTTTGGTRALRHRNYLRGAWAGLSAPLAAASIVNASVFLTYGLSTRTWDGLRCSLDDDDDDDGHSSSSSSSFARNAMCGGIAGIVSSFVVCPVDLVKTRMQNANVIAAAASSASVGSSSSSSSSSSLRVAREILGNHGVAGLYRGLGATAARQCPGFVAYFGSYDATRSALLPSLRRRRRRRGDDGDDDGISSAAATTANATGGRRRRDELLASIAAGGLSGTLSWAIVYPLDLIKTRIQSLPHDCRAREWGMVSVGSDVVRRHGWRALYRGFGITMMRAFPVNGIIFPTYEMTSEALGRMR
jgi:solute carrier family 25 carnitine/acylcarnitine transporter 20/29